MPVSSSPSREPVRAVFIGPMASGKSKLGRSVASALGASFRDTDKMVVAEHGDIPGIFATHGEAQFRQWEREAVMSALDHGGVVSLGGGAILNDETRANLTGLPVIYLHITRDAVADHLATSTRPLLADGIDAWERIFNERRHLYEQSALVDFDTSSAHRARLTDEIVGWIRKREAGTE